MAGERGNGFVKARIRASRGVLIKEWPGFREGSSRKGKKNRAQLLARMGGGNATRAQQKSEKDELRTERQRTSKIRRSDNAKEKRAKGKGAGGKKGDEKRLRKPSAGRFDVMSGPISAWCLRSRPEKFGGGGLL